MNRSSLDQLYETHCRAALRLAYLLSADRDLAQDLVHDAFVRLFGRFRDLRDADHFEAYLRKTIVNLSKDQRRKKTVERAYIARQRSVEGVSGPADPDDELRAALIKLPHRQRAAVALRYLEDLSEQQTAEVMDISVAAVKALTQRGAASLRRHLGGEAT